MMTVRQLLCASCGRPFDARRRDARTCSKICAQRLRRGARAAAPSEADQLRRAEVLSDADQADRLHDLTTAPSEKAPSARTYAIVRGPAAKIEMLAIDRLGRITCGPFFGVRIGDLMQTAAKQGWLAWRRRADCWNAAEWCPERKTIALCGPCAGPRPARSALAGPSRDGAPENARGHVDVEDRQAAAAALVDEAPDQAAQDDPETFAPDRLPTTPTALAAPWGERRKVGCG